MLTRRHLLLVAPLGAVAACADDRPPTTGRARPDHDDDDHHRRPHHDGRRRRPPPRSHADDEGHRRPTSRHPRRPCATSCRRCPAATAWTSGSRPPRSGRDAILHLGRRHDHRDGEHRQGRHPGHPAAPAAGPRARISSPASSPSPSQMIRRERPRVRLDAVPRDRPRRRHGQRQPAVRAEGHPGLRLQLGADPDHGPRPAAVRRRARTAGTKASPVDRRARPRCCSTSWRTSSPSRSGASARRPTAASGSASRTAG